MSREYVSPDSKIRKILERIPGTPEYKLKNMRDHEDSSKNVPGYDPLEDPCSPESIELGAIRMAMEGKGFQELVEMEKHALEEARIPGLRTFSDDPGMSVISSQYLQKRIIEAYKKEYIRKHGCDKRKGV